MGELAACCHAEAGRNLKKHRDVAVCDQCGNLVLAYGQEQDFESTKLALAAEGQGFDEGRCGELWLVSKRRAGR